MRWILLCCLACLVACDKVKVKYVGAATTGTPVSSARLQELAKSGYEYVALTKTVLVVTPRELVDRGAATQDGAHDAPPVMPKGPQKNPSRKTSDTAPASRDVASTPAVIGRDTWVAVPTPIADYRHAFLVKGIVNAESSTTLAISRYPDSDRVASVASTAVNLVPKRIEQVTTVASTLIQLAALPVSTDDTGLRPFTLELPPRSLTSQVPLQPGWGYTVEYPDEDEGAATVSFAKDFETLFENGDVNYWPVQACRLAKLTLFHDRQPYVFFATVADPDRLRLQPLPISGKLELGPICGASVSGVTSADPLAAAVDDVTALQQAARKLNLVPAATATPASATPVKR